MTWKNSTVNWGRMARGLHWFTAILMLLQFILGWTGPDMQPSPLKIQVLTGHKSLGITILFLLLTRILWRWLSPAPAPAADMRHLERVLSTIVHALIYLVGVALALSGWLAASTTLVPWKLWWLLPWPRLTAPDKALHETFATAHEWLSWLLLLLIVGHILAALRHHFLEKNDVLKRMWRGSLLAGMLLLNPLVTFAAETRAWVSDAEAGELGFTARYEAQELDGRFTSFDTSVEQSGGKIIRLAVTVDTGSVDMNDEEVNEALATPEWFDSETFPRAVFESSDITQLGEQAFVARGELTIKRQTRHLEVPFNWQATADQAELEGQLELSRLDWLVGSGDWADTSVIADGVKLRFRVHLAPVD